MVDVTLCSDYATAGLKGSPEASRIQTQVCEADCKEQAALRWQLSSCLWYFYVPKLRRTCRVMTSSLFGPRHARGDLQCASKRHK